MLFRSRDNKPNLRKIFTQSLSENTDQEFYIYSIEFKGFKLISMDTFCSNSNKGELTSSKIKLLSNEISHLGSLPTAIFMHHPPYNVSDNEFERFEYVDIEEVTFNIEFKKDHYVDFFAIENAILEVGFNVDKQSVVVDVKNTNEFWQNSNYIIWKNN